MCTLMIYSCGRPVREAGNWRHYSRRLFLHSKLYINTMRISSALAAAGLLLIAAPVLAAGSDARLSRGGSISASAPASILPAAMPSQASNISIHHGGSIHSTNTVSTNSGGNSGSNVVTGEQSSTVTVINIAPANNDSAIVTDSSVSQPTSPSQCTGRTCPRAR